MLNESLVQIKIEMESRVHCINDCISCYKCFFFKEIYHEVLTAVEQLITAKIIPMDGPQQCIELMTGIPMDGPQQTIELMTGIPMDGPQQCIELMTGNSYGWTTAMY